MTKGDPTVCIFTLILWAPFNTQQRREKIFEKHGVILIFNIQIVFLIVDFFFFPFCFSILLFKRSFDLRKQGGKLINKVNVNLKESSAYNFYSCIFDQAKEQGLK